MEQKQLVSKTFIREFPFKCPANIQAITWDRYTPEG
jgi:hypothetical protein